MKKKHTTPDPSRHRRRAPLALSLQETPARPFCAAAAGGPAHPFSTAAVGGPTPFCAATAGAPPPPLQELHRPSTTTPALQELRRHHIHAPLLPKPHPSPLLRPKVCFLTHDFKFVAPGGLHPDRNRRSIPLHFFCLGVDSSDEREERTAALYYIKTLFRLHYD
jgi:hypothetical protein